MARRPPRDSDSYQPEERLIVNYPSRAGLEGNRRLGQGAGSTWGLSGLTKSWALELAPYGVRVVSIHSTGNPIPDPWNESGDFAKAVLRFASDRARFERAPNSS